MSLGNNKGKFRVENSPRDDRFFTPRAQASSGRSQADSINDFGTPRTSREDTFSSRSFVGSSSSESEYVTPRLGPPELVSKKNRRRRNVRQNYGFANSNSLGYRTNQLPLSSRSSDQYYDFPHRQNRPPLPHNRETFDGYAQSRFNSSNPEDIIATSNLQDVEEIFSLARHSRFDEVTDLLSHGVPANIRDQNGNTILSIACQNGNKRMAKVALRFGANINAMNVGVLLNEKTFNMTSIKPN